MHPETLAPSFCRVCGTRLQSNTRTVEYDPFTGQPVTSDTLHCPNPTTTTETKTLGRQAVSLTYHPTWSLDNGNWSER